MTAAALLACSLIAAAPVPKGTAKSNTVVLDTSHGVIEIELDPDKAPVTVKNFLAYVEDGFYDGLTFHRIIPTFMIQGGGYDADMKEKKGRDPIPNEAENGLSNAHGTISMARTAKPDSATSQFFINTKDNKMLDRNPQANQDGYCVFGKVTKGLDVVDAIAGVKTGPRAGLTDVPVEPVTIKTARRK
jgi:peptidyl-prolyl cis-trans isomerase A (cyclophilin A)